jgi:hypothetical protein
MAKKNEPRMESLSEEMIADLIGGTSILSGVASPFRNNSERRKCFLRHEAELLRLWVEKRPGTRPSIFWDCVTEPRKKIGEGSRPLPFPRQGQYKIFPILELEIDYLRRLNLFYPDEERRAFADDGIRMQIESQENTLRSHKERVESSRVTFINAEVKRT